MSGTEAQSGSNKANAFLAKAAVHGAMTFFTAHWGTMLQAVGEETCEKEERPQGWRDAYEGLDGTGHTCINTEGEFDKNNPRACLECVEGCIRDVRDYRTFWENFTPNEEQAVAFQEAMALLDQAEGALMEAAKLVRLCLPEEEAQNDTSDDQVDPELTDPEVPTGDDPGTTP